MRKYFNYRRSNDEAFNSLVDATLELARAKYEGKNVSDYSEKNAMLIESMSRKMVEGTRYEADFETEGTKIFERPMVRNNSSVRENFNAVIAQVVNAIVPEVVNDTFSRFISDVTQVGFGDTGRFIVASNELFKVNSKAEGVRKGIDQPIFDDEITLNARPCTID